VGEAGGFHEIVDADAVDATLSKQPGGCVEDFLAVFGGLNAAYSHQRVLLGRAFLRTIYYMTDVMIEVLGKGFFERLRIECQRHYFCDRVDII
jgi:hypothetical protein